MLILKSSHGNGLVLIFKTFIGDAIMITANDFKLKNATAADIDRLNHSLTYLQSDP